MHCVLCSVHGPPCGRDPLYDDRAAKLHGNCLIISVYEYVEAHQYTDGLGKLAHKSFSTGQRHFQLVLELLNGNALSIIILCENGSIAQYRGK